VALLTGFSSTSWGPITLPLDLAKLGAGSGCVLSSSGEIFVATATTGTGTASVRFQVPSVPALVDHALFHTWLIVDPKAPNNALGLVTTRAGAAVLGL
jgi:hypothetical protein